MSECTVKNQRVLEILKKRYRDRFITPLAEFFTKPPILYDAYQIRLRKQMEQMLDDLDRAELCSKCSGRGVVFERVEHTIDKDSAWKQVFTSYNGDSRAVVSDICDFCFGNGIILPRRSQVGGIFKEIELMSIKCPICKEEVDNVGQDNLENEAHAKCLKCNIIFSLENLGYRIYSIRRIEK